MTSDERRAAGPSSLRGPFLPPDLTIGMPSGEVRVQMAGNGVRLLLTPFAGPVTVANIEGSDVRQLRDALDAWLAWQATREAK